MLVVLLCRKGIQLLIISSGSHFSKVISVYIYELVSGIPADTFCQRGE